MLFRVEANRSHAVFDSHLQPREFGLSFFDAEPEHPNVVEVWKHTKPTSDERKRADVCIVDCRCKLRAEEWQVIGVRLTEKFQGCVTVTESRIYK